MSDLMRYDPFSDVPRLGPFRDLDDLFRGFLVKPVVRDVAPSIKVDVSEGDRAYIVRAEIPGVRKQDVDVSVDGKEVSIGAEVKKRDEQKEGEKVIRSERYYGRVFRSFALDHDVDPAAATAKYIDGVLELTLPKKPGTSGKAIKVS